jgi:hypothetical protein
VLALRELEPLRLDDLGQADAVVVVGQVPVGDAPLDQPAGFEDGEVPLQSLAARLVRAVRGQAAVDLVGGHGGGVPVPVAAQERQQRDEPLRRGQPSRTSGHGASSASRARSAQTFSATLSLRCSTLQGAQ